MDREKVINELVEHIESALDVDSDYVDCVRTDLLKTVVGLLKEQEAVVRCKDCENSKHWYGDKRRCFLWHESGIDVFDDGFCNYGKHKECEVE